MAALFFFFFSDTGCGNIALASAGFGDSGCAEAGDVAMDIRHSRVVVYADRGSADIRLEELTVGANDIGVEGSNPQIPQLKAETKVP
eukprot:3898201-Rhodomonas_salina.1